MTVQLLITLPEDSKAALDSLAEASHRTAADVAVEAVNRYLDHDRWFRAEVQKGLDSLDRGERVGIAEVEQAVGQRLAEAEHGRPE